MKTTVLSFFSIFLVFQLDAQSGLSWNTTVDVAANSFGNMHPRMAIDGSGNPLLVWGRNSDKAVMFSRWEGSSFSTPLKLNADNMEAGVASWMGPDIASHGDTVYIVAKRMPEMEDTNHIYLFRSFDGGQNFLAPVQVDQIGDSLSWLPTVTCDPLGNPLVAFMKLNADFLDSRWVVSRSSDFGNTFALDVKASGWDGSEEVCDCCPGALISSGDKTAMLYRNNHSNIRDIWMGLSEDDGTSFASGATIDNNNWQLMACPSSGPDGVIIGDTLYSVYMSGGSGSNRVYSSKTPLNSPEDVSVERLTAEIAGLSLQNFPRIEKYGNAAAITWLQISSSQAQLPILFTEDITQGFPNSYDTVDLTNITNSDVALNDHSVFVAWQDNISGTVKFRAGTYGAAAKLPETKTEAVFTLEPNPVSDILNIHCGVESNILICDLSGKKLWSQAKLKSAQIDLSSWEKGIYYVSLQSGSSIRTAKFVKN